MSEQLFPVLRVWGGGKKAFVCYHMVCRLGSGVSRGSGVSVQRHADRRLPVQFPLMQIPKRIEQGG